MSIIEAKLSKRSDIFNWGQIVHNWDIIVRIKYKDYIYYLLGPPGAQKGLDTRSKCVVSMSPTQAGQSGAVGTKSAPPGPSQDLCGPKRGLSGPKRALFTCFLELGGYIYVYV